MGAFQSRARRLEVETIPVPATRTLSATQTSASATSHASPASVASAPPEASLTPAERRVLDILRARFTDRLAIPDYMCVQLMRSSDLKPHGLGNPARVALWAQKAGDLIERIAAWRKEHDVDGLRSRTLARRARFDEMWPEGVSGVDMYGRPVHWQAIARIPAEAMMREFTVDEVIALHVQGTERARDACLAKCKRDGHAFIGQCEVLDLTGFGVQHLSPKFFRLIRAVMDIDLVMYDNMMAVMVVLNTPWLFAQMWRLLSPLITEETKQKIFLCDEKASAKKLRELGISPADRIAAISIAG